MKAYRHRNGQGLAYGEGVHLSADTLLDRESTAEGETSAHATTARACALKDALAFDCFLNRSAVGGSTLSRAHVTDSVVDSSVVSLASVVRCRLRGAVVEAVSGLGPFLLGVALEDVTVSGDVTLRGPWAMRGPFRIDAGTWERPPRHLEIAGENGVSVGLSECVEGKAHVACHCKPVGEWLEKVAVARRLGWTEGQISDAVRFLEGLR